MGRRRRQSSQPCTVRARHKATWQRHQNPPRFQLTAMLFYQPCLHVSAHVAAALARLEWLTELHSCGLAACCCAGLLTVQCSAMCAVHAWLLPAHCCTAGPEGVAQYCSAFRQYASSFKLDVNQIGEQCHSLERHHWAPGFAPCTCCTAVGGSKRTMSLINSMQHFCVAMVYAWRQCKASIALWCYVLLLCRCLQQPAGGY